MKSTSTLIAINYMHPGLKSVKDLWLCHFVANTEIMNIVIDMIELISINSDISLFLIKI